MDIMKKTKITNSGEDAEKERELLSPLYFCLLRQGLAVYSRLPWNSSSSRLTS
jgi:hypothetical protein